MRRLRKYWFVRLRTVVAASLMCLAGLVPARAQKAREFGAGSIKLAVAGDHPYLLQIDAARLYARAASLRYLITEAYGIENYQVVSTAKWMNENLYTINATIPAPSDHAEVMEMLRNLLAQRFHLKVHNETRQTRIYELVVASGGSKLQPLQEGVALKAPANLNPDQMTQSVATTLPDLARYLNRLTGPLALGWPVIDRTGMSGKFRIWLTFRLTPDIGGRSGTYDIDFLSELPRQLGLRLQPARADCSFVVVDSASMPSAN